MIFLLLSIACSTAIFALFKLYGRWELRSFQAIVANYFIAAGFGFYFSGQVVNGSEPWLWIAAVVGALFISLFYIMALTSQVHGVSVTGIATKMSMLIPAVFFILTDPEEGLSWRKAAGIGLGIVAVILASTGKKKEGDKNRKAWLIPVVLFIGSGCLDLLLAYAEKNHLGALGAYESFVPVPFAISGVLGALVLLFQVATGKEHISWKSLAAGIPLGLVNYGSIYFLLRVLGSGMMDRSSAIPANNMGVVALSALVGIALFHERLSAKKLAGLVLSLLAILLLTWRGYDF